MNRIGPSTRALLAFTLLLAPPGLASPGRSTLARGEVHVWELQEITLRAAQPYANPYAEVVCWIDLEGPGFARRVYGFWDGGRTFKVRFVATAPGGVALARRARTSRTTPD